MALRFRWGSLSVLFIIFALCTYLQSRGEKVTEADDAKHKMMMSKQAPSANKRAQERGTSCNKRKEKQQALLYDALLSTYFV